MVVCVPALCRHVKHEDHNAVANEKVGFLHAIILQLSLRISDIFLDIGDNANLVIDTMPFVKLTI